ncbi:MAG: hypothetical protein WAO02_06180 [Verrucomicrobiia bacterium]
MFNNDDVSVWYRVIYWATVTVVFGISLLLTLKLAQNELERAEKMVIILVSSLVMLIPAIGPSLAFIVAIFLIYKWSEAELGMAIGVVVATRFLAILVAIGLLKVLAAVGILNE